MKDFAQGLVLKQRHTVTRKWPTFFDTHISRGCKLILNLKSTNEFSQVTIQMKTTEQYCHMVLFIILHNMVVTLSLWIKPLCVTIQMKAIEQHFYVFITLYTVVLIFKFCETRPM